MTLTKTIINFLLCAVISVSAAGNASQAPLVKNGTADLRNTDLKTSTVRLDGDWKFYPSQLITKDDSLKSFLLKIPSLWSEKTLHQKNANQGYGTYSATIILPQKRPELALAIPDVYTSLRVIVNDKIVFESGTPAADANNARPHWKTSTIPLETNSDTLHILLQVANFWHSKGGISESFVLGEKEGLLLKREQTEAFDLTLTGCLFMGGLFFFGLYLFGKHDKAILFFSLFCMMYSYRISGSESYTLHSVFPSLSWFTAIRLEYLTLYVSVGLFVQYTRSLYPDDVNKTLVNIMTGFCLLFALTVVFPPAFFTKLITVFLIAMFVFIAYAFYIYLTAVRRNRIGSRYALISTAVVLFVFALINLNYFQVIPLFKGLVFIGYIAFFFLQSLILSYRFATTLKIAKRQAEEGLSAKSAFLSTISHEIRTPLNSVIGTAHIMLNNQPRADQRKQLDILLFSANNLLNLVNDVLDFNKIEANKIEFENIDTDVKDLTQKVAESLRPMAAEKGIEIIEHIDQTIPRVLGDPMRLAQVLTNLIHNAVKFTEQGTVAVRVENVNSKDNRINIRFNVVDTGIGIAEDKQTLIFEQFTQADSSTSRSFGGTGLGLAITKRILEQQGSYLFLKSVPNEGSTFYFTLNLEISSSHHKEKPQPMQPANSNFPADKPLKGVHVLLVEDNDLNIFVAKSFLEQWGAIVDVAENGKIGVETADPSKHQIILMDMHMPVMDGYEATETLRNNGIKIPIIALTASISKESESRVLKVGADGIIIKPFEPDSLLETVKKYTSS